MYPGHLLSHSERRVLLPDVHGQGVQVQGHPDVGGRAQRPASERTLSLKESQMSHEPPKGGKWSAREQNQGRGPEGTAHPTAGVPSMRHQHSALPPRPHPSPGPPARHLAHWPWMAQAFCSLVPWGEASWGPLQAQGPSPTSDTGGEDRGHGWGPGVGGHRLGTQAHRPAGGLSGCPRLCVPLDGPAPWSRSSHSLPGGPAWSPGQQRASGAMLTRSAFQTRFCLSETQSRSVLSPRRPA